MHNNMVRVIKTMLFEFYQAILVAFLGKKSAMDHVFNFTIYTIKAYRFPESSQKIGLSLTDVLSI